MRFAHRGRGVRGSIPQTTAGQHFGYMPRAGNISPKDAKADIMLSFFGERMMQVRVLQQQRLHLVTHLVVMALLFLTSQAGAQTAPPDSPPADSSSAIQSQDIQKLSRLLPEFIQFFKKIQASVQFPPPRSESRLLPLLPASTVFYAAMPNYGDASHQILTIFRQEIKENAGLHKMLTQGDLSTDEPKLEDGLEKFYQISQYLGDEIVVSVAVEGHKDPTFLMIAEAKKPGLSDLLQAMVKGLGKSAAGMRVFDVSGLATAKETVPPASGDLEILVRPDYVVAASDLAALRNFNTLVDRKDHEFAATPFGQRLEQAYQGGTTLVAGADLQTLLKQIPPGTDLKTLERSGFGDMKYLILDHNRVGGEGASQMELSFTGPRHGVASWLTAPGPMPGLDFVSPKAMFVSDILLKNPVQIFDEFRELATASNPNALTGATQMEQAMNLNLRDDLFGRLGGEITLEVDRLTPQEQLWKAILRVKDPEGLQTTLNTLMAAARIDSQPMEEDGVTYHTIPIPMAQKALEIGYAFVDGYLVIASSREAVADAVRMHRTGDSLAKSNKYLAALPPGNLAEVSALFYEDPIAVARLSLGRASPALAAMLPDESVESMPVMVTAYGDESAIREASRSGGVDAGAMMVMAAIAIPNLLRARIAANESSAVASIRTANTAEIIYANTYPKSGFARDLATLGPDPGGSMTPSAQHASVIDATLGGASCTANAWCEKSGYSFRITSTCAARPCRNYVVVATPMTTSTGTRSFCSASDGVVRTKTGPLPKWTFSAAQCLKWPALR